MALIELQDIQKVYRTGDVEVRALRGVSLTIDDGDFAAIMGPSGSGKSTLMHTLGCLDRPTSGRYMLDGQDVSKLDDNQLAEVRNRKLGFVFQSYNLLARTPAIGNVELPLLYSGGAQNRRERAAESLRHVGLEHRMDHEPSQLSGGEQQRVAIARALVNKPRILLGDEPTGNLDSRTGQEIIGLLQDLNDQGVTLVVVTHDEHVAKHARRIIRLFDGKLERDEQVEDRLIAAEAGRKGAHT
jgi:putative ABC transport system ATP-binding protein